MLSALTIDPPEKINMAQKILRTNQRTEVRVKWGGEGQSLRPSVSKLALIIGPQKQSSGRRIEREGERRRDPR